MSSSVAVAVPVIVNAYFYTECRNAEWRYAECRGALNLDSLMSTPQATGLCLQSVYQIEPSGRNVIKLFMPVIYDFS